MKEAKVALKTIRRSEVKVEMQDLTTSIEREDKRQWKRLPHSPLLVVNIVPINTRSHRLRLDSILWDYVPSIIFLSRLFARVNLVVVTEFTCMTYTFFGQREILISTRVGIFIAQCTKFLYPYNFSHTILGVYIHLNGPCDWMRASYPEGTELLGTSLKMNACSFMSLIMNSIIM
ncbi:hypothetical protein H5410_030799 [Solanum commersonii]|uniref:Uncharacterized protein n=1 Tax=Solanum commersonii TaxID=4109 RepID=A0A9J5YH95_SOLCO|nr:hypothetical protein H5410_030799 [Solanum commersonii]